MKTNLLKPLLGLTASLPLVACSEQTPQQHPNIIFFLVDDYGWADSQVPYGDRVCERNAIFNTPNMVRLAQAGVTLTNAYASPLSTPTRSCILTGVHPAHSGITNYTSPMRDWPTDKIAGRQYAGLDPNDSGEYIHPEWTHNSVRPMKRENGEWVPTGAGQRVLDHSLEAVPLPQILKDNGYYTIHIGKGHWAPMGIDKPFAYYIDPVGDGHITWSKPVVVLTNRSTFSAANNFVSVMKLIPGVTVIGATTGGGSGMPYSSELPNGWGIRFSACSILDAQGRTTEFGIAPTAGFEVDITPDDTAVGKDPILDRAISHILSLAAV